MAEETKNVDDLLTQIGDFEKTLDGLKNNVDNLRKKLTESKEKYGVDINKWPQDAK
jgi:flagellin-like hook-associated protein FlgL